MLFWSRIPLSLAVTTIIALLCLLVGHGATAQTIDNTNHAFALPQESALPGAEYLESIQKYSSIGADGDLRINIPLFTVPGALPVPLNLNYKSGIKLDQSATWVGLGWNLGGWSVKRVTVHGDDPALRNEDRSYTPELGNDDDSTRNRYFIPDFFAVSTPMGSYEFYNEGTVENPVFVPISHTHVRLEVKVSDTLVCPASCHYPFECFILTDSNETRYVFAQPMKSMPTPGPRRDYYNLINPGGSHGMISVEWLLTAILSHDYVDGSGDPLDPIDVDTQDPRRDNQGTWVGFRYSDNGVTISDGLPNPTDTLLNGPWDCNPSSISHTDSTEITYLRRIVTPSTVVDFSLYAPENYKTIRYIRSEENAPIADQGIKNLLLSQLRVFEYDGKEADPTGPELFAVTFNYEYADSIPLKQSWHEFFGGGQCTEDLHGEPTLRSVVLGTDNTYQPTGSTLPARELYQFGDKKRFEFRYESVDDIDAWFTADTTVSSRYFDAHRNFIYGTDWNIYAYAKLPSYVGLSYMRDYLWMRNTVDIFKSVWGTRDVFGYHYVYPWAWSLTHMITPEGLAIEYEYESDEYTVEYEHWYGGGCRVSSVSVNDGTIGRDIDHDYTIDITYGLYGGDGLGYATSMPNNWIIFTEGYRNHRTNLPLTHGNEWRFMGDNADHVIQYPRVTWGLPGGKGSIEYDYTTTQSVPGHRFLYMVHGDEVPYPDGVGLDTSYYAFWLDRSPLHGIPIRTAMKDGTGTEVFSKTECYTYRELGAMTFFPEDTLPRILGYGNLMYRKAHPFLFMGGEPDTIAICYRPQLDSVVTVRDGVESVVRYGYEVVSELPDPCRITHVEQSCLGENKQTQYTWTAFDGSGKGVPDGFVYQAYPSRKCVYDGLSSQFSRVNYTYDDDAVATILYLRRIDELIKGDRIESSEILTTYFREYDQYGNATLVRRPDSVRVASVFSYRGLEAEFVNIDSLNYAYFSAETDFNNQPQQWQLLNNAVASDSMAFTGCRSIRVEPETTGLRITMSDISPGMYIVDCWARAQGSTGYAASINLTTTSGSASRSLAAAYQWQHLVCSLQVSGAESLVCEATADDAVAYFDDIRIYPEEAMVTSYAYDALMRPTSASDQNNIPTRTVYNQYGEVLATSDYQWAPVSGSESFLKSTDALSSTLGVYRRDLPNAVHSISNRGGGVLEVFTGRNPDKYEIAGEGTWLDDGKLWFQSDTSDVNAYSDIAFPVNLFADGFMAFDFWDSTATGDCYNEASSYRDASNLWFGFDGLYGNGLAVSISRAGYFEVWRYIDSNYTLDTMLASVDLTVSNELYLPNAQGKRRLGLARLGDFIYFFHNGECVYRCQDDTTNVGMVLNRVKLRCRFPRTGASWACSDRMWIDNLVFYSDPSITTSFVNSLGLVKQTQTLAEDGVSIIVSGTSYTPDRRVQAAFKPIEVQPTTGYGQFAGISGEVCAFDYIDQYLVSDSMLNWEPGQPPAQTSYLYSYFSGGDWPDMTINSVLRPYTEPVYADDPLQRVVETRGPGVFSAHSVAAAYDHICGGILPGFYPEPWESPYDLYRTTTMDENGHKTVSYQDQLGRTIAVAKPTQDVDPLIEIDSLGSYVQFHKDILGYDTLVVQTEGQEVRRKYSATGWLMEESSPDFGTNRYMYDQAGNLRFKMTATDEAIDRVQYFKYDNHNRLIENGLFFRTVAYPGTSDDTLWCWDSAIVRDYPDTSVNRMPTIDSLKKTAEYIYDQGQYGRGRLTKAIRYASGHPDSASWEELSYDARGQVTVKKQHVCILDSVGTTRDITLEYNNIGQVTRTTYNNGKYIDYTYDRAGRVAEVNDDDFIIRAQFDYWPSGQVKTKTLGNTPAQVIDYKYNARDWLVSINDGAVVDSTTGNEDHFGLALEYTTGAYQGPQSEYPAGYYNGNIASYEASVSDNLIIGGIRTTSQSYAYDALDRLAGESFAGFSAPDPQLYRFDRNGNLDSVLDDSYDLVQNYTYYEGTNRLKTVRTGDNADYTYTPSGSISEYARDLMNLDYNLHEQLAARSLPGPVDRDTVWFWYNTSGQRIAKRYNWTEQTMCWRPCDSIDPEPLGMTGLMAPLVDLQGDTVWNAPADSSMSALLDTLVLSLDGDSLLGMETLGGGGLPCGSWVPCNVEDSTKTAFYYLGDDLLFDYFKAGYQSTSLIGNYVYVNGERIAKFEGNSVYDVRYYLTDHLGSVAMTVGHDGTVKSHNLYRPWGEKLSSTVASGTDNQFQYTGQYQDEDLSYELAYYGARYYDQNLKIFTSVDPLWMKDVGLGNYIYCRNNPLNYVDRDGTVADPVSLAIEGAIVLGITATAIYAYETDPAVRQANDDLGRYIHQEIDDAIDATLDFVGGVGSAIGTAFAAEQSTESEGDGNSEGEQEAPPPAAPAETNSKTKSLENRLAEHQQKLNDYMNDPDGNDNRGFLKDAAGDQARRQQIINGRIKSLKHQIKNFQRQIDHAKGPVE